MENGSGKRIMTFGTFDLFHKWHMFYLTEAKKLGAELYIVIARDERVLKWKWKHPIEGEDTRKKNVQKAFPDATVILGDVIDIFEPIRKYAPDVLVFWYDQKAPEEQIHRIFPSVQITRIPSFEPDIWKSSKLRNNHER